MALKQREIEQERITGKSLVCVRMHEQERVDRVINISIDGKERKGVSYYF